MRTEITQLSLRRRLSHSEHFLKTWPVFQRSSPGGQELCWDSSAVSTYLSNKLLQTQNFHLSERLNCRETHRPAVMVVWDGHQDQQQKLLLCVSQQQMMFDKQMVAFKTIRGSWDNLVVAALWFPLLVKELWSVHKKHPKSVVVQFQLL